jgi:hypothetical protein
MIRIVTPDGTPVATAGCLSATAEILRQSNPGWYFVLEETGACNPPIVRYRAGEVRFATSTATLS